MILVDTSVWADHIARRNLALVALLESKLVAMHPFILGELALGNLRDRSRTLRALDRLPRATVAFEREVLDFIDRHALYGSGIGYVDAHLLVSARLGGGMRLWSRDRRLRAAAVALSVAHASDAR